jgi:hypothetical protein
MAVKEIRNAERERERESRLGGSPVAEMALGACALDESVRILQQHLYGARRGNSVSAGFEY